MEEFEVKEYRSGYTRVRYALGFVPKQVFGDNPERYVIRAVRGNLMVYSIIHCENASGADILRALKFQDPDGYVYLAMDIQVDFVGNAFRFSGRLNGEKLAPFLYVTTTLARHYFRGFGYGMYDFNAFFTLGVEFPNEDDPERVRLYDDLAMMFYSRYVLKQDACCLATSKETGDIVRKTA